MARSAPRLLPLGIALVLLAALTSRTSARSEASFNPSTVVTPKAGFTVPSFKFNFKFDFQRVSNPLVFFAKCQKSSLAGYSSSKQLSNGYDMRVAVVDSSSSIPAHIRFSPQPHSPGAGVAGRGLVERPASSRRLPFVTSPLSAPPLVSLVSSLLPLRLPHPLALHWQVENPSSGQPAHCSLAAVTSSSGQPVKAPPLPSRLPRLPLARPPRRLTDHWQAAVTSSSDQLVNDSSLPFRLSSPSVPHLPLLHLPLLRPHMALASRDPVERSACKRLFSPFVSRHLLSPIFPFSVLPAGSYGPGRQRQRPRRAISLLTLHWQAATPSSDQLQLALEAKKGTPAAASWFAVGWSRSGKMGGSNVIVMEEVGSAPGQYDLESDPLYTAKAVAASWSASSYSITEDDKSVVMQFSRGIGEDSSVPVKRSGYSNMIWAYGAGIWEVDGGHDAK
ncbi:unnamed protein product [Closterium sp. NIES-65]|nr:unnamed protein product [Closterium sp. NIES-65]